MRKRKKMNFSICFEYSQNKKPIENFTFQNSFQKICNKTLINLANTIFVEFAF